jgi:hypothetical protein
MGAVPLKARCNCRTASPWQMWSDIFALPLLAEDEHREPAARRRRHDAISRRWSPKVSF